MKKKRFLVKYASVTLVFAILMSQLVGCHIDLSKFETLGEVVKYTNSTQEEAMTRLKEHNPEVIINNKIVLTSEVLSQAPALKMIAETATGFNNIDLEYAKAHNIRVANVAGYSTQSVIQHTFAMMFSHTGSRELQMKKF